MENGRRDGDLVRNQTPDKTTTMRGITSTENREEQTPAMEDLQGENKSPKHENQRILTSQVFQHRGLTQENFKISGRGSGQARG